MTAYPADVSRWQITPSAGTEPEVGRGCHHSEDPFRLDQRGVHHQSVPAYGRLVTSAGVAAIWLRHRSAQDGCDQPTTRQLGTIGA
jgi:hypothetical protein